MPPLSHISLHIYVLLFPLLLLPYHPAAYSINLQTQYNWVRHGAASNMDVDVTADQLRANLTTGNLTIVLTPKGEPDGTPLGTYGPEDQDLTNGVLLNEVLFSFTAFTNGAEYTMTATVRAPGEEDTVSSVDLIGWACNSNAALDLSSPPCENPDLDNGGVTTTRPPFEGGDKEEDGIQLFPGVYLEVWQVALIGAGLVIFIVGICVYVYKRKKASSDGWRGHLSRNHNMMMDDFNA